MRIASLDIILLVYHQGTRTIECHNYVWTGHRNIIPGMRIGTIECHKYVWRVHKSQIPTIYFMISEHMIGRSHKTEIKKWEVN